MNKIYLLTGCDGTGKTTLANKIAEETKGHVLHCSYDKDWNIEQYHTDVMETAQKLAKYQDVVIDRWAMDEFVYGTVLRGGPSYDTSALIEKYHSDNIVYIYCENENTVENHKANSKKREEMFEDMNGVSEEFEDYIQFTSNNWLGIPWVRYNYNWIDIDEFTKGITK